ncbi:STY4851/ECs_5259 family protein [Methylotuvimicrobium sp. KM2]|uniref:STY4851/ECs_5259 family protein n=1 Tax=Methylotuvimicrobium sp. KM2 TaxID=3133976 RepID=UPI003101644E
MKKNNWLTQFIFTHARITVPDGRPLYAYKCEDKKYEELKEQVIRRLKAISSRHAEATYFPCYFCLFAAETFCREHDGGIWAWETVFKPLGIDEPEPVILQNWIEGGLKWWNRPLIKQNGRRRFLTTIACEGGLPLRLLQKNNAAINQFFKAILEGYHRQGYGGIEAAEMIGRLQAFKLPPGLRQDVVFHLGGELIASIVDLQREIGTTNNPISILDKNVPDWRRRLPLRLEEQTAESLFNGLVIRTNELTKLAQSRLRWVGKLKETPNGWQVQKCLECPDVITSEQICHWLGRETQLPPRLRLLLKTPLSTEVIALLTLTQGSGKSASYRREWTRRGGLVITNDMVKDQHLLFLHVGDAEHNLAVESEESWGDLPWLFITKGNNGDLHFLGEGSRQTRAENAWVLVPEELSVHPVTGAYEKIAKISNVNRILYKLNGTADFLTDEKDRYRITCQAEIDFEESYSLIGSTLTDALNSYPLYLGVPRISWNKGDSNSMHLKTQWKQMNTGAIWNDYYVECVGRVWLRLFDSDKNIEIFRRQVVVLPKSFRIERTIGQGTSAGTYLIQGLTGASISSGTSNEIQRIGDDVEITYPTLQSANLPQITLYLNWGSGREVSIALPYPQRGAVFQLAGVMLTYDEAVSLDRLGGLRLFLQDHAGGCRYWLEAELISADAVDCELPRLRFRDRLPMLNSGRLETALLVWQDRIASLLNSSRSLDALVRLEITTPKGETLARINIARFDCFIDPNFPAYQVRLSSATLEKIGQNGLKQTHMEMLPLWSPKDTPISLEANPEHIACWNLPDQLTPGPWWIIGRDGDWARFRPILWSISGDNTSESESKLESSIRESNKVLREQALEEVLQHLGHNPEDTDWFLLFDLIGLSREFPSSSLDVLTRLVSHPQTLALALLKADDDLFDCVWSLAEQLPFSWSLLSANCWQNAAKLHIQSLQSALGEIDANGDIVFGIFQQFRERACSRREYWSSLCDWLHKSVFKDKPLQNSPLLIARKLPSFFDEQIIQAEQELQGRHDAEEQWPQSPEVLERIEILDEWHQYQHLQPMFRSVRCAPFLASRLSVKGALTNQGKESPKLSANDWINLDNQMSYLQSLHSYLITENLIYELRLLRAFDPDWFDTVYAIALTIELSKLPLELSTYA